MRIRPLVARVAAATAVLLVVAGPALGSSVGRLAVGPRENATSRPGTAPNLAFAGYVVNGIASAMATTTTMVVPHLKCTQANRAIAASTGMFTPATYSAAELFVGCVDGKPRYFPVLTVNGTQRNYKALAVRQGDRIVLKAADGPRGARVSVIDATNERITKTAKGPGSGRVGGPWLGDLAWSNRIGTQRVPNFGTLRYSNSKLNGRRLGSYRAKLERFNRVTAAGTLQIETGKLVNDRESFRTFFEHS